MLGIIEWLIPDETKKEMTSAEWLMLTLAVYFHDLGMVVTKDEYEKRESSSFKNYKNEVLSGMGKSEYVEFVEKQDECFLYQEFVRENHAKRIKQWIEGSLETDLGDASTIKEIIEDILKSLDKMFKVDLAMICESHHEDDIDDFTKYRVDNVYGNDKNERVNLNYIAVILRIGISEIHNLSDTNVARVGESIADVTNKREFMETRETEPVGKADCIVRRISELGGYENVSDSVKADIFGFDIADISGSIRLFSDVMKRLGIKLDGDGLYEEFQRLYDESVDRDADKDKMWNRGRGR